jgi:hypothetical protein
LSTISLVCLRNLTDLDIQTLHPLTSVDLIHLFATPSSLPQLNKLALPRHCTDNVIECLCKQSSCVLSLTHLNLNNCPSLSNRALLLINKYLLSLRELSINYNTNINDFAFIGLSICGIGKSIEWLEPRLIERQLIDDLSIWTCTIVHRTSCQCQLPSHFSSACIKLRLKDFNFDSDDNSDRILVLLTEHERFHEYFPSINRLQRLKSLKLRQCIQLTSRLFRFGIRSLLNLKSLDLNGCDKLTDQYLMSIGQTCPSIETIDLTGCHRISDVGRRTLRENARRLKIVDF